MYVVTYETGGDYARLAHKLAISGKTHGINVNIFPMPARAAWYKNVAYKPWLLRKLMSYGAEELLYVDADCVFRGALDGLEEAFDQSGASIMVRHRPPEWPVRYNVGVLLLRATPQMPEFLQTWERLTEKHGSRYETCDQPPFEEAVKLHGMSIADMPTIYNAVAADHLDNPVIFHTKFSKESSTTAIWKAARRLETALVGRLSDYLAAPAPAEVSLVFSSAALSAVRTNGEIHLINCCPPPGMPEVHTIWLDRPKFFSIMLDHELNTKHILLPTSTRNAVRPADWLRSERWGEHKVSELNMIPRVCLYYPGSTKKPKTNELPYGTSIEAATHMLLTRKVEHVRLFDVPEDEITCYWYRRLADETRVTVESIVPSNPN